MSKNRMETYRHGSLSGQAFPRDSFGLVTALDKSLGYTLNGRTCQAAVRLAVGGEGELAHRLFPKPSGNEHTEEEPS